MKESISPYKKKLISSFISLCCILGLLILCVILLPGLTFSWFSQNESVGGDGMGIGAEPYPLKVEYARLDAQGGNAGEFSEIKSDVSLNFLESDVFYPGYSVLFKIRLTNTGISPICIHSVGFCEPTEDEEKPRVVESVSYYLGTQLSASVVAINDTPIPTPTEQRLLTVSDGEPERIPLTLYTDTGSTRILQPSEHMSLTVRLLFVDENTSQDVYRNFGKEDSSAECCRRRLFATYEQIK